MILRRWLNWRRSLRTRELSPITGAIFPAFLAIAGITLTGMSASQGASTLQSVGTLVLYATAAALVWAVTRIRTGDVRCCTRCSYAIDGLDGAGVCPECGLDLTHPASTRRGRPWRVRERWTVFAVLAGASVVLLAVTFVR